MLTDSAPVPEEEQLKALEKAKVEADMQNYPVPENEDLDCSNIWTLAEHKLVGGTMHGLIQHPNEPRAYRAGFSLQKINEAREKQEPVPFSVTIRNVDGNEYAGRLWAKLKPLSQDQIDGVSEEPTYEIVRATTHDGKPVILSEDPYEICRKKVETGKLAAINDLRRELGLDERAKKIS